MQAPAGTVEVEGEGGAERERGRKWREERARDLEENSKKFQSLVDEAQTFGASLSKNKKRAPTTLV